MAEVGGRLDSSGFKAFYAAKYGESLASTGRFLPGFNLVAKIKNGDEIVEVNLKEFTKNLEAKHGLDPLQVKKLQQDLKENGRFGRAVLLDDDLVRAWEVALNKGIDDVIRRKPEFLEMLSKYPFGTSKRRIVDEATDIDFNQIVSGRLVDVPDPDPVLSQRLRDKFGSGTQTSKKYDTDPSGKEFDAITSQYFVEHKALSSTNPMSSKNRAQMKFQMRSCKAAGKNNYLIFEGVRNDDWINKAIQYANEYGVNTKIELNGTILHDLTY